MTSTHRLQSQPWQWNVTAATRLPASPQPRWLVVDVGRAWLTRSRAEVGAGVDPDEDLWLGAGGRLLLPAGSEWVIEGWPLAQLALLEAPRKAAASTAAG